MHFRRSFLLILLAWAVPILIFCQTGGRDPFVKISGEVSKPLTLYKEDLAKMKQVPVAFTDRNGKSRQFTGTPVLDILAQAGVTLGKDLRGENLTKYMMVKCADGYEVLFSLAELDSSFTDRKIVLVFQSEGKPLSATEGPFRVVVPGEKKPARSCMQVTELVIRYAKE
ncbi:MAG: molybdopterin-dependent oxidoreductase [Williamsia sp.]|nr:molybdopterin-dependent oxidoreductase [Williamsia sp.]